MYDRDEYPALPFMVRIRTAALRRQIRKSVAKSNLTFCQTPVVKKRFAQRVGYPEDKIRIVRWPPPIEVAVSAGSAPPLLLNKSGGDFFVLLLTRYLPHRNPGILLPLCGKYAAEFRRHRIKFVTTLDTKNDKPSIVFNRAVRSSGFDDIVVDAGVLGRTDVRNYLLYSDILWLPTYIETLCLPFLEAMVLGTPILAPDLDFARYVCGEAAEFFNIRDIDSAFAKIMLLKQDSALRKSLVEKGRAQLQDKSIFSANWEEVAADMLRELRQLAQQPNQGEAV
jgi:glycosyltransferase involved in cell wall biosynthesis